MVGRKQKKKGKTATGVCISPYRQNIEHVMSEVEVKGKAR
jgi:hypothetical protein